MTTNKKVLLIDNYDSFTYNLVQMLMVLEYQPLVIYNDALSCDEIAQLDFSHIIISPGPGHPSQAGVSLEVIRRFAPQRVPILGVCLGHQALAEAFGAKVIPAPKICHGKLSMIEHHGKGIFSGLKKTFQVTRYHSLVVSRELSPDLEITAWNLEPEHEVMALQHRFLPCFGVQFHPEAILTENGFELLKNFLIIRARRKIT